MTLSQIPTELSCLNALEIRLISLRVPFMKMVALPSGKQRCIHGPAVNVPSKLESVCTVLPRLPSQSELIPLKLKRKLTYKAHYMYDYVTPEKILNALRWLKIHNPLYTNVEINETWAHDAEINDHDLYASLVNDTVLDSSNSDCGEVAMVGDLSTGNKDASSSITSMCLNTDVDNVQSTYDCTDMSNLQAATNHLIRYTTDNHLLIHEVPGDGNCLYNAVLYQLESNGVITTTTVENLRQMVATHLQEHSDIYMSFVTSPIVSDSPWNHDTAAPDDMDVCISSISDHNVSSILAWERYLERITSGSWGDHVVIAALANIFNVTINVVHARQLACNVITTSPADGQVTCKVNLGLLMQYHYVGLDKQNPEQIAISSHEDTSRILDNVNEQPDTSDHLASPLDDVAIKEGDEHTRQITGSPLASMMFIENPEAFAEVVCLAPAEGQKPLSIMIDSTFEAMSNPDKFPTGDGCFYAERPSKLTYRKYFNQRLLDADDRFAKDIDYLFVAQYIVEAKQILDDATNFIWRQKPGRDFTAQQAKDQSIISQCLCKDTAYRFMKNVRGSPPYYQRTFYDLLAMIRQLGTPTWFLTLSAADMKWPDIIQTIARQYGVTYTDDQIASLSFEEKSNWIRRNPVTTARHYQYRLNTFFKDFLKSPVNPLRDLADHAIRIEFQARGSRMLTVCYGSKMLLSMALLIMLMYANLLTGTLPVQYLLMRGN